MGGAAASGPSGAPTLPGLVAARTLDAELAALAWLALDAGRPLAVGGGSPASRAAVRDALLGVLPDAVRVVRLAGADEDFRWMPEAIELGWRHDRPWPRVPGGAAAARPGAGAPGGAPAEPVPPAPASAPARIVLVADLDPAAPGATWGDHARLVLRAPAVGYGLALTVAGDRLEAVLDGLAAPPVGATGEELGALGLVLVLGADRFVEPGAATRAGGGAGRPAEAASTASAHPGPVVAAHLVRPLVRDAHGHVRREPPAVVATLRAGGDGWDHFAWGLLPALAGSAGLRPVAFERAQAERARLVADLARRPGLEAAEVRAVLLDGARG